METHPVFETLSLVYDLMLDSRLNSLGARGADHFGSPIACWLFGVPTEVLKAPRAGVGISRAF